MAMVRTLRPAAETDLQRRLRFIESECNGIARRMQEPGAQPTAQEVAELAHLVVYLAAIVGQHFQAGEV